MGSIPTPATKAYLRGRAAVLCGIIALFSPSVRAASLDISAFLSAIRQVEGVTYPARPGLAGELGFLRLTKAVWTQHTRLAFWHCGPDPVLERFIGEKHVLWLSAGLTRAGLPADPYHLAMAWNAGLTATINHRASIRAKDYARRVVNLLSAP